jgi:hypothetical protein
MPPGDRISLLGLSLNEALAAVGKFIDEKAEDAWADYEIVLVDVGALRLTSPPIAKFRRRVRHRPMRAAWRAVRRRHARH